MDNKKSQWTEHHRFFFCNKMGTYARGEHFFIAISYSCFEAKIGIYKDGLCARRDQR